MTEGDDGRPLFYCFAGCEAGHILDELRRRGLIEPLRGASGAEIRPVPRKPTPRPQHDGPHESSHKAESIWRRGRSPGGTAVEAYLAGRGCPLPRSGEIRYLPPTDGHPWPCMMGRITDAITAVPLSLHFTLLSLDGTGKAPVPRQKLLLPNHRKQGGVIRLVDDGEVTTGLGIAEGIETALSVIASGWSPVWCAIDAGNIAAFPVLDGVESLTVFSDQDAAGIKAALACQARWREAGKECAIAAPPIAGTDWNDLQGAANG